jgi:hypothetical protein
MSGLYIQYNLNFIDSNGTNVGNIFVNNTYSLELDYVASNVSAPLNNFIVEFKIVSSGEDLGVFRYSTPLNVDLSATIQLSPSFTPSSVGEYSIVGPIISYLVDPNFMEPVVVNGTAILQTNNIDVVSNYPDIACSLLPNPIVIGVVYSQFTLTSTQPGVFLPVGEYFLNIINFNDPLFPYTGNVSSTQSVSVEVAAPLFGNASFTPAQYQCVGSVEQNVNGVLYAYTLSFGQPLISEVYCFAPHTMLECADNVWKPVTDIVSGTLVRVYSGDKEFAKCKYVVCCEFRGATETARKKDRLYEHKDTGVILSGGHSILVDTVSVEQQTLLSEYWKEPQKIGDKQLLLCYLCDGFQEFKGQGVDRLFSVVLESENIHKKFGIYAKTDKTADNGGSSLLVESMSDYFFTHHSGMSVYLLEKKE